MKLNLCRAFFLVLAVDLFFAACSFKARDSSLSYKGESLVALNKNSARARISSVKKSRYMFFKFKKNLRSELESMSDEFSGASVGIEISFSRDASGPVVEKPYMFGFLYEDDFSVEGNLAPSLSGAERAVSGDFEECGSNAFCLELSLQKGDSVPCGFFFYSSEPCEISRLWCGISRIGWSKKDSVPLFSFGPSGGRVAWDFTRADFRDAASLFPLQNIPGRIMPRLEIELSPCDDFGPWDNQKSVTVSYAGENVRIRRSRNPLVALQTSAFRILRKDVTEPTDFGAMEFGAHAKDIDSVFMVANSPSLAAGDGMEARPLETDLGLVLSWPRENWRRKDFEIFKWNMFPRVLFFDFADYRIQNQFFTRLAYFAEKAGYKGTLVGDDFVESKHGYNAHDYKADDLASFFTLAEREGFRLNERELQLRQILIENKIIMRLDAANFAPARDGGAVVSISRESPDYLRRAFLAHESWHGVFFTQEKFRDFVGSVYDEFDPQSMRFLKTFWATQPGLGYDTSDDYLMRNEFMSYIMQQGIPAIQNYFLGKADWNSVNRSQASDAAYLRKTKALPFVEAGRRMNDYVYREYGLAAGRVFLVSRL